MTNPRIIRALELIHEAKKNATEEGLSVTPALLVEAENELLRHIAEQKKAERASR